MIDWDRTTLFTTEPDTCVIGCGTPLIFLKLLPGNEILYCCPSCEGIWGQDLFVSSTPRFYSAKEFSKQEVSLCNLDDIPQKWHGITMLEEGEYKKYYLDVLLKMFGKSFFASSGTRIRKEGG